MKAIVIESTKKLPQVVLNAQEGHFEISGRSLPEDARTFYEPVLDWLNAYSKNPNQLTKFKFDLEYFNTSSSVMILSILYKIKDIMKNGNEVLISWYSSEEDLQEAGMDYEEVVEIPFEFIHYDDQ